MDSNLVVAGCTSPHLLWSECSVDRSDASGIANARARTRGLARQLGQRLKEMLGSGQHPNGVEVAVQNRAEGDLDEYWVGTATKVLKVHDKAGSVGRVRFDVSDMEVQVVWKQRDAADPERRTFVDWKDAKPDEVYTINSTELRRVAVELVPELPTIPDLGTVRRSTRQAQVGNKAKASISKQVKKVKALPKGQKWVTPSSEENVILGNCCS
jgi:hypothetical protein